MKKLLPFLLSLFLVISCEFVEPETSVVEGGGNIEITYPNESVDLQVGNSYSIRWNSDLTGLLKIELSYDSGNSWETLADSIQNTGSYVWGPIPNKLTSNGKIKISSTTNSQISDQSDTNFRIIENALKVLILTSPKGGETFTLGSKTEISWISSKIDNIKIEFSEDNGRNWSVISESVTANNSKFEWNPLPSVHSEKCLIRISDVSDNSITTRSNSNFSIVVEAGVNLLILSPNGGEEWAGGTPQEIKWFSEDIAKVKLEYSANNGIDWETITDNLNNTGIYYWNSVPNVPSTLSKIRITNVDEPTQKDVSDDVFSILPEPAIKVLSPNGGENWLAGSSTQITWSSTNIAKVKLEYTLNNGANWIVIEDSINSNGSYNWTSIPNANSTLCRIRISDAKDGNPFDISDADFEITNQIVESITVVSPNGNEIWQAGTAKDVTWNSTGVDSVKIEYTPNNGLEWIVIVDNLPSAGSYSWSVPDINSTQVKVRISDAADSQPSDESDGNFVVKKPGSIKILAPISTDVWEAGQPYKIRWESDGVENVRIEFTTNNGDYNPELTDPYDDDFRDLVKSAPAAVGEYEVIFSKPSTEYVIRVGDAEFGSPADFSAKFTVAPAPDTKIEVVSPNGGENWLVGQEYEIRWIAANIGEVKIEYTLNNTDWIIIEESVVSNGLYNWKVPASVANKSELCKIRISDPVNPSRYDVSDDFFAITPKVLRLIKPNSRQDEIKYNEIYDIEWYSTGIDLVRLEYTINNGQTWQIIEDSYQSVGSYSWNPPDLSSSLCRVKITDVSTNAGTSPLNDQSDETFKIQGPNDLQPITVIAPNGGEVLQKDSEYKIKWTATNIQNIRIELTSDGETTWSTIANNISNNGEYNWAGIPDLNSANCKIRISNADAPSHFDLSDAVFSINNQEVESVEVVSPNGGEKYESGTKQTLLWKAQGIDNVKIQYTTASGSDNWTTIVDNLPHTGSYEWEVPVHNASQCKIRVLDADDDTPFDDSDTEFTIEEAELITILTPVADENIMAQEDYDITWVATGIEKVRIEATAVNGIGEEEWFTVVNETPNDGSFIYKFTLPSDNYVVRISDAEDGNPSANSPKFKVKPQPEKTVQVYAPNGGEKWIANEQYQIRWDANLVENVKIEYTIDDGFNWQVVTNSTVNNGSFNWTVPNVPNISLLCKIRISDASDTTYVDESDANFTMYPPKYIRLHQANGGEYINIETHDSGVYPIMWESAGVDSVKVEYSRDNGNTWITLSNSTISDGVFGFMFIDISTDPATIVQPATALGRFKVSDVTDPTISDISDGYFYVNIVKKGE